MPCSAQGVERQEEGDGQREATEDQHILLAGGQLIHAEAVAKVFLKAARLVPWADVLERFGLAAANRAAKAERIEGAEGRSRLNRELLDPLGRVEHETAAAAFEAVRIGIVNRGLWCLNGAGLLVWLARGGLIVEWVLAHGMAVMVTRTLGSGSRSAI